MWPPLQEFTNTITTHRGAMLVHALCSTTTRAGCLLPAVCPICRAMQPRQQSEPYQVLLALLLFVRCLALLCKHGSDLCIVQVHAGCPHAHMGGLCLHNTAPAPAPACHQHAVSEAGSCSLPQAL